MALKYRPDVDGLRALAVLPVVLFHAGVPGLEGGYVGVDVFFVISGFLITSIVQRDVTEERFSIANFYERRAKRLLPALFFVVLATTAVAAFLLLPTLFKDYAQSVGATALFSSNALFFQEAGYFDAPAEAKPLLHTWSLAVEEQFYFFYPPILLAVHRWARGKARWVVLALTVASLAANLAVVGDHQSAAFYLLPFRAWELGLGALLALGVFPKVETKSLAIGLGFVGTAMVIAAVVLFSSETQFPGIAAALPVVGSALIIAAGNTPGGPIHALLSNRVMTFIGKTSYSTYLWHWPIVVFARYATPSGELSPAMTVGLVVASLAAGALSWRLVEEPFRRMQVRRAFVFGGVAAVTVLWVAFALVGHVSGGLPQRLSERAVRFGAAAEDFVPEPPVCGVWADSDELCVIGDQDASPSFLMWGDSHAGILVNGMHRAASEAHASGVFSDLQGCPALIDTAKDESVSDESEDARCAARNELVLETLRAHPELRDVVLVGRWAYYANGGGFGVDEDVTIDIWRASTNQGRGTEHNAEVFAEAMADTLAELRQMGRRVYVFEQPPEMLRYTAARVAREIIVNDASESELSALTQTPRAAVEERQRPATLALDAAPGGVTILRTRTLFCDDSVCDVMDGATPRYFDNNHVTTSTAVSLAPVFAPMFEANDAPTEE